MAYLPPESLSLTGGCHCGAVRYTVRIPAVEERPLVSGAVVIRKQQGEEEKLIPTRAPVVGFDHCHDCRHAAGSIMQCWLICPSEWVDWSERFGLKQPADGAEKVAAISCYSSSKGVTRTFCGHCGTHLTYRRDRTREGVEIPPLVDITVGSLDDSWLQVIRPERHLWWDSAIGWVRDMFGQGQGVLKHSDGNILHALEE